MLLFKTLLLALSISVMSTTSGSTQPESESKEIKRVQALVEGSQSAELVAVQRTEPRGQVVVIGPQLG